MLKDMENATLESFVITQDTKLFNFSCGNLAVYNPVQIENVDDIKGATVQSINFTTGAYFKINLTNKCSVTVSLQPHDYSGPEAFSMRFNNGIIVVE